MKKLIAYGKDIHGDTREFDCSDGMLDCKRKQLTELKVPEGVTHVWCYDNYLTELIFPEGVKRIGCSGNQLTELILPEGVEVVYCEENHITHLDLPESVTWLYCDKEVIGLERYIGKVTMYLI